MIRMLAIACTTASPALADTLICQMSDGSDLSFVIDRNQFMDAVDANEPPRRKVTTVRHGAHQFTAEPLLIGQMRGFHADGMGGTSIMFVVTPDGSATYTNAQVGQILTGDCEDQ
jgi:hypothetical protein